MVAVVRGVTSTLLQAMFVTTRDTGAFCAVRQASRSKFFLTCPLSSSSPTNPQRRPRTLCDERACRHQQRSRERGGYVWTVRLRG